jgi:hypothetical protein
MLAGGKRERERGGENQSHHPCTRAPEWNFLGWLVKRGKRKKEDCSLIESEVNSKILKVSLLYPGSLNCRSSRPGLP